MNVFKWLLVVAGIVLVFCGVQLVRYAQAIDDWQAEAERLELQAESDYYRGVMSACTGIGVQMEVPGPVVAERCAALVNAAYRNDWFNELRTSSWTWPPKKE